VKEKKVECQRHSDVIFYKRILADEDIVALFAHSTFVPTTMTHHNAAVVDTA
jgi:hypothetical protein